MRFSPLLPRLSLSPCSPSKCLVPSGLEEGMERELQTVVWHYVVLRFEPECYSREPSLLLGLYLFYFLLIVTG